jgi:hypothetical protein
MHTVQNTLDASVIYHYLQAVLLALVLHVVGKPAASKRAGSTEFSSNLTTSE